MAESDEGFEIKAEKTPSSSIFENKTLKLVFGAMILMIIPVFSSMNSILMRKMRNLHENTVSLIINPAITVSSLAAMYARGFNYEYFTQGNIKFIDWCLLVFLATVSILI